MVCLRIFFFFFLCDQLLSRSWPFIIPWTVAHQAPLSTRFPRQEYQHGLPSPAPEDLSDPGNLCLLHPLNWQADSLPRVTPGKWETICHTPFYVSCFGKQFLFLFFANFNNRTNSWSFWRRQWHPTPVLLPGKSHGHRSLVGCSPWGCKELDTTEWLHFHFSLSCIGGGNGNPLQCYCLENPWDSSAWWAAIYGVAHSQTRLKWLSSSSSSSSMEL